MDEYKTSQLTGASQCARKIVAEGVEQEVGKFVSDTYTEAGSWLSERGSDRQ